MPSAAKITQILVPVDYSECSLASCAYAVSLAEALGAKLDIVHAWERPSYVSDAMMLHREDAAPTSIIALIRDGAEAEMREFLRRAAIPAELVAAQRLLAGNPSAQILEELAHGAHQLVVVGTHGKSGLKHALLGGVASTLVRLSPVPVLTVRG